MAVDPVIEILKVIGVALVSGGVGIYTTRTGNWFKKRELDQSAQQEFMTTVIEELDGVKAENKTFRQELDALRDELRGLRTKNEFLERERQEHLRVLRRVAACQLVGCINAARAAEFLGDLP